jgi:hypothetical protein
MYRMWMLYALVAWFFAALPVAHAQGFDPAKMLQDEAAAGKSDAELAMEARMAKLEAMLKKKRARVLVLPWPDSTVGHENLLLQELTRNLIGRPSAQFFPSLDLYQEGRRRRYDHGQPVPATKQTGSMPDALLQEVREAIRTERAEFQRNPSEPYFVANRLFPLISELWFIDRPEARRVLFELYLLLGRVTQSMQNQVPPYFSMIGRNTVNYGVYAAAAMLWEERDHPEASLAALLPNDKLGVAVQDMVAAFNDGTFEKLKLSFHDEGVFDPRKFAGEYTVFVNGLAREVLDDGILEVPRGRIDLHVLRNDGFSLSESVLVSRLDEKIYFVLETARQRIGHSLLNQLMDSPATCAVRLDNETRGSLATYAALHPNDEIYVAIPRLGSARDVYVWRYDRTAGTLELMIDRNRGFPVRFAVLSSVGMVFNGATISGDKITELKEADPAAATTESPLQGTSISDFFSPDLAAVPVDFQLRGHFNRLMFGFGVQLGSNVADEKKGGGKWRERYQTQDPEEGAKHIVVQEVEPDEFDPGGGYVEAFKELEWQRLIYGTLGVVLLKDAPFGMGPRGYVRVGWYNAPHAIDLTGHIGITEEPSFGKKEYKGRVAPLLDADFFAGAMIPFGDSLYIVGGKPTVLPTFGFTVGTGFTF